MLISRRRFIERTSAGLTAAAVTANRVHAATAKPLNILIIGGTGFLGPAEIATALARGHKVTLLNRNRRENLFAGKVEQLIGDLNGDVSVLKDRSFDVVIDNPTTAPFWVRNVAQYLKGRVGHYIYVSTLGVYPDLSVRGLEESMATTPMPADLDPYTSVPEHRREFYYPLKSFSERLVETIYPGISSIIRSGLIVGPNDNTDRFLYWVARIARGGSVLAPGAPTDRVQMIDARDLAEWMIRMAEERVFGVFNATGPAAPLTIGEMLYGIKAVTTSDAQFTWVPASFIVEHQLREWDHLPVWVDPAGPWGGLHHTNITRARTKGLTFRSLAVTAKDALDWHTARPDADQQRTINAQRAGLAPAREQAVLAAWLARRQAPLT